jgi:hypothetical protein
LRGQQSAIQVNEESILCYQQIACRISGLAQIHYGKKDAAAAAAMAGRAAQHDVPAMCADVRGGAWLYLDRR